MNHVTNVLMITGFLGSGKTTFLNKLLAVIPDNKRVLVLVNEFGTIGIDANLVKDDLDGDIPEIIEISNGSIFCACVKADFIKALLRIANEISPDILIIEATGVANPSDLQRDMRLPAFKNRFYIVDQVCLLDAQNFATEHSIFFSLEKQIKSSSLFIINKIDLADSAQIAEIKNELKKLHPDPEPTCIETKYANFPLNDLLARLITNNVDSSDIKMKVDDASVTDYVEVMRQVSIDSLREMNPPEDLYSRHSTKSDATPDEAIAFLKNLPSDSVVRGKGIFRQDEEFFLVESILGRISTKQLSNPPNPELVGVIVLIFTPEYADIVEDALKEWTGHLGAYICG
jgi:G3E family GTPase